MLELPSTTVLKTCMKKLSTLATLAVMAAAAHANQIAYIASSGGYMLHNQGGNAVTRDWNGASPIQGFSGYGAIRMDGQCLTGKTNGQTLRWESCRGGDKGQVWKLSGRTLNNELGFCADVQGNRIGAGVPVLAWNCSGAANQQWKPLGGQQSAQAVASRISDSAVRSAFLSTAQSAGAGTVISLSTGRVVSAGGANAVSAGGANVVSAGGGNVVSAGGMN